MKLFFLGTGGGRFVTSKQVRKTGGMFLEGDDFTMHIDPGPGALVSATENQLKLDKLDYLAITHSHLDHSTDANPIIEAMTAGSTKKRGTLITSPSVIDGYRSDNLEIAPTISKYHLDMLSQIEIMKDMETLKTPHFKIQFFKLRHNDPETYGFTIEQKGNKKIGFISDSTYFSELLAHYQDCPILVINTIMAQNKKYQGHMSTLNVRDIINKLKPETVILHHFGFSLLYSSLHKEAQWLRREIRTDTKVIWAKDFQTIDLSQKKQSTGLREFVGR